MGLISQLKTHLQSFSILEGVKLQVQQLIVRQVQDLQVRHVPKYVSGGILQLVVRQVQVS